MVLIWVVDSLVWKFLCLLGIVLLALHVFNSVLSGLFLSMLSSSESQLQLSLNLKLLISLYYV
jgi:hypothetical protein